MKTPLVFVVLLFLVLVASISSRCHAEPGVYAIQCGNINRVKIGRADDIGRRLRELQTGCPYDMKLLAILSNNPNDERSWHRKFKRYRRHGEWFEINPEIQREIEIHK